MTEGTRRMTIVSQDWSKYDLRVKQLQKNIILIVSYIIEVYLLLFGLHISPLYFLKELLKKLKEKEGNKKEFDEVLKGLVDANEEILPFIDKINELVNSFSSLSKDDLEEFVDKEELENLVKSFNKTKNLKIEY